jgi:hypothetical protein
VRVSPRLPPSKPRFSDRTIVSKQHPEVCEEASSPKSQRFAVCSRSGERNFKPQAPQTVASQLILQAK